MRPRHAAFVVFLAIVAPTVASAAAGARSNVRRPADTSGMVRIPAGSYRPLYGAPGMGRVRVGAFALDSRPVSRAGFLAFVRLHPEWSRSSVRPIVAEPSYLADWAGVLDAGSGVDLQRPVTSVSWFAAKAFCAARDKRLPTLDEWEYVAAASETRRDASADPAFRRHLLALYAARSSRLPIAGSGVANVYGVRDLHESGWEWTLDYHAMTAGDDARVPGSGHEARDHRFSCASAAIGATDPSNYPAFMRFAMRAGLTARATLGALGFRCAADQPV